MNLEREALRNTEHQDDVPSNRFREWYQLIPKWVRREYVYNVWKAHRDYKLRDKAAVRIEESGSKDEKEAFDAEYASWEKTLLRGIENRTRMEGNVLIARNHFGEWLKQATDGKINTSDVLYAVLWGSSFITPRNSKDTDLDIGVILKENVNPPPKYLSDDSIFGLPRRSFITSTADYTGRVDFFIHKPIHGRVSFLLFPHAAIYNDLAFTRDDLRGLIDAHIQVIRDDIDSALGRGKISQADLRAMVDKWLAELLALPEKGKESE